MKRKIITLLWILLPGLVFAAPTPEPLQLWYRQPAQQWVEALPVGNGRIGAMVFGGTTNERIQFNEHTLWTGEPRDYSRPGAANYWRKSGNSSSQVNKRKPSNSPRKPS